MSWSNPGSVAAGVRSLIEPTAGPEGRLLRADALRNACDAYFHLGQFEESIRVVIEAERLEGPDHDFTTSTAYLTAYTAALVLDLPSGAMTEIVDFSAVFDTPTTRIARALDHAAPSERRETLAAEALRYVSHNFPGEESIVLALMAFYAIRDGELDRGRYRNETVARRSPATFALKRHNSIRIGGLPDELIADERHHRRFLAEESARPPDNDLNRRKMLDEDERLLR